MAEQRIPSVSKDVLASIAAKVATKRAASAPAPETLAAPAHQPYYEAAAVLSCFDPFSLRPVGAEVPSVPLAAASSGGGEPQTSSTTPLDALLSDSVHIAGPEGAQLWSLKPGPRINVLRQLRQDNRIQDALGSNPPRPNDPVDQALRAYLSGSRPPLTNMTRDELSATRGVTEWLREAGFPDLPTRDDIVGRFEWNALLEPFAHLATLFGGRQAELATLREYADVLAPDTFLGAARAAARRAFNFTQKPPLVIYGPGGVGKSTLVARFILEHTQAHESDRFPFAYLDFDRTEVAFDQPITLLVEAVRQLGVQYPTARDQCEALRRGWLSDFSPPQPGTPMSPTQQAIGGPNAATLVRLLARATRDFVALLASLGVSDRPVLLVLDTFEEVQRRSEEYVDAIWRLLEDLRSQIPRLRVVIVGRAELPRHQTQVLALKGLDQDAAVSYLMGRGISDRAIATRLANQLGGSPLSLKLAAELFARDGFDASRGLDITTREYFFLRLDDALIQRQLYTRILSYVQDEEVRRLAHPGLVLRQLTPELILYVLKGPCQLDSIQTIDQATALFQRIRKEVALVTDVDSNTVKHRPDLRLLMVPLVRSSEPEKSTTIDEGAVAYYSTLSTSAARAEEIYHRLWLDQPFSTISSRWLPGVEASLATALDEFSGARKAYLAARLNVEVDVETRQLAELEDWEQLTERKASDLLMANDASGALALLHARTERSASSPLPLVEARALVMLNQGAEAVDVLDRGIARAIEDGARRHALALATYAARVAVRFDLRDVAPRYRARFAAFAQASASPLDRLAVAVPALAMAMLESPPNPDTNAALQRDVLDAFDAAADAAFASEPELTMWVATMLRDPARLARVLRLVTIRPLRASDVRGLSGEIAMFDLALSQAAKETPGLLARRFRLAIRPSLTETWSDFLTNVAPELMQKTVADILRDYSSQVPAVVIDSIARLPRFALGFEEDTAARQSPNEYVPPPSPVTSHQMAILEDALREAFPTRADLEALLFIKMERRLDAIASPSDPSRLIVSKIVHAANAQGWIQSLVTSALEARPNHATLHAAAKEFGVSSVASDLESFVSSAPGFVDIGQWRDRLGLLEGQVCRIEVAGAPVATGFLVGPDLVLTADVALAAVFDGHTPSTEVACRFDYKADASQQVVSAGTLFRLHADWLIAHDPWIDELRGLGYVLLRVQDSPGVLPIGGATFEAAAVLRRWIELPVSPRLPEVNEGLVILQHPLGAPLKLAVGSKGAIVGISGDATRLLHTLNTEPGSAGSPCFSMSFELVAMHIGSTQKDPRTKLAVPLTAIVDDLRRNGWGGFAAFA